MIIQKEIILPSLSRGMYLITDIIVRELPELPEHGLLNLFIKHTSAALSINENFDPSVPHDLNSFMNQIVPENYKHYTHTSEGADDMPAHIKSSLLGVSLTIPIQSKSMALGTWQGIYLCEFRNQKQQRRVFVTIFS
ncbi:MAG: secondary thiamine-phosphate synthase [Bacteroidetes bacterium HGW-Bacteroidetes-21]|jgi:secondary thiamine-phosphate synthase enzyme|nr:MAG: secondary thiamine-phosphate synthase [Bacteroidetes bacterium HGW-Bacteroidetes-21]